MTSRSVRVSAVLLTLVQLAVWGFYAPAHRLIHHSHLVTHKSAGEEKCHAHCCHHHSPVSAKSSSESPGHPTDSHCPDDEQNCDLCALAMQLACAADSPDLVVTLERVEPLVIHVEPFSLRVLVRPFDSRGPPSA